MSFSALKLFGKSSLMYSHSFRLSRSLYTDNLSSWWKYKVLILFLIPRKKLSYDLCVVLGVDKVCPVEGGWVKINRGEVLRRLHQLCPAPRLRLIPCWLVQNQRHASPHLLRDETVCSLWMIDLRTINSHVSQDKCWPSGTTAHFDFFRVFILLSVDQMVMCIPS